MRETLARQSLCDGWTGPDMEVCPEARRVGWSRGSVNESRREASPTKVLLDIWCCRSRKVSRYPTPPHPHAHPKFMDDVRCLQATPGRRDVEVDLPELGAQERANKKHDIHRDRLRAAVQVDDGHRAWSSCWTAEAGWSRGTWPHDHRPHLWPYRKATPNIGLHTDTRPPPTNTAGIRPRAMPVASRKRVATAKHTPSYSLNFATHLTLSALYGAAAR